MTSTELQRAPVIAAADEALRHRLEEIWKTKPGLFGWLGTVDHKRIGVRYMVTSFAFLLAGGLEALVMRLQLGRPDSTC